jgi:hypothetical protein
MTAASLMPCYASRADKRVASKVRLCRGRRSRIELAWKEKVPTEDSQGAKHVMLASFRLPLFFQNRKEGKQNWKQNYPPYEPLALFQPLPSRESFRCHGRATFDRQS